MTMLSSSPETLSFASNATVFSYDGEILVR